MTDASIGRPPVVSADEWEQQLAAVREQEKAATRQLDAVAAARRQLPMTEVRGDYPFQGVEGSTTLMELFDGRSQLVVYHFMFGTDWDAGCSWCSWVADAMSHPAHLHARDVSFALTSLAPIETLTSYQQRMGWDLPWYSSGGTSFNADMGATVDGTEEPGVSVFLREGDQVYRTYFTGNRGLEHLGSHWTYLDLTPYGRQESWQESPEGWPQQPAYEWIRRHDEY